MKDVERFQVGRLKNGVNGGRNVGADGGTEKAAI
jgi:hypothetical protein